MVTYVSDSRKRYKSYNTFAFSMIDLSKNRVKADRNLLTTISSLFDSYMHEGNKTRKTIVITAKHVISRDGM